jgi:hypothetical protein
VGALIGGVAAIFWSCALIMGGGSWINRASARKEKTN